MVGIIRLHRKGFINASNQSKRQGKESEMIKKTLLEKWLHCAVDVFVVQDTTQKLDARIASRWGRLCQI